MDPDTGLCTGCLRTLDEIAGWSAMDEVRRAAVWYAITQRRAASAGG